MKKIEEKIKYEFNNKTLLENALIHSSYANEKKDKNLVNNERLEFLGDAVLELVISELLYNNYSNLKEGDMTKVRASLVCESSLSKVANKLNLGNFIKLGKGEESTGGRNRKSILSDALEALIGAMYLDGNLNAVKEFIQREIFVDINVEEDVLLYDSKTTLQEIVQMKKGNCLEYETVKEEGPDHNKLFTVAVKLNNIPIAYGKSHTKKAAEQKAALKAIKLLKDDKCI